jgi:PIN domain nuclease of toxin-antitoxin system
MAIKLQLGKLQLNRSLSSLIITQQQVNDLQILTVQLVHVLTVESLPDYHKDPFDRLLIAQAITENLPILSRAFSFSGLNYIFLVALAADRC